MSPALVEFIGGPRDGDVAKVDRRYHELVVPMEQPGANIWRAFANHLEDQPWKDQQFRTGIYRRSGANPAHMLWIGER